MKISLVTVCYNAAATIEATLKSVVAQSYTEIEYIVVDGNSKDQTLQIINRYSSHIHTLISEPDCGLYDAMNKGFKAATGEVIGILNADDTFAHSEVIAQIAQHFEASRADALYGDLEYIDSRHRVRRRWKSGKYKPGAFLNGWMPPHPTFYCKRSMYERHGYFRLDLKSAADYELMLRFVHKHGISLSYLPEVLVRMQLGGMSNSSWLNRLKANNEDRRAWEINGLKPKWYTLYMKPLRKINQFF
jgi:glycosyltransferase involved in cell wall biosynthesis